MWRFKAASVGVDLRTKKHVPHIHEEYPQEKKIILTPQQYEILISLSVFGVSVRAVCWRLTLNSHILKGSSEAQCGQKCYHDKCQIIISFKFKV